MERRAEVARQLLHIASDPRGIALPPLLQQHQRQLDRPASNPRIPCPNRLHRRRKAVLAAIVVEPWSGGYSHMIAPNFHRAAVLSGTQHPHDRRCSRAAELPRTAFWSAVTMRTGRGVCCNEPWAAVPVRRVDVVREGAAHLGRQQQRGGAGQRHQRLGSRGWRRRLHAAHPCRRRAERKWPADAAS